MSVQLERLLQVLVERHERREVVRASRDPDSSRHLAVVGGEGIEVDRELGEVRIVVGVDASGPGLGETTARIGEKGLQPVGLDLRSRWTTEEIHLARWESVELLLRVRQDHRLEVGSQEVLYRILEVVFERP